MKKYVKLKKGKVTAFLEEDKVYKITGVALDKTYVSGIKISIKIKIKGHEPETYFDAGFFDFLGSNKRFD